MTWNVLINRAEFGWQLIIRLEAIFSHHNNLRLLETLSIRSIPDASIRYVPVLLPITSIRTAFSHQNHFQLLLV